MKRTVLYTAHVALEAKLAPFAGFEMPIQYPTGIIEEHRLTRTQVTVFDTCHMGELRLAGPTAAADLETLVSCRVANLAVGRCRYGLMCNPAGGVIDDLVVYRLGPAEFLLVVNAGTKEGDLAWVQDHVAPSTVVEDRSPVTGKLDLQGPGSVRVLARVLDGPLPELAYYAFVSATWQGVPLLVSRTGYTGEIGFELYGAVEAIPPLWQRLLELGAKPAGLGARDTLRLEMGYPLYGHELNAARNAATAGLTWALDPHKPFTGAAAVRQPDAASEVIAGLRLEGRSAGRAGDRVRAADGQAVGTVTSGSFGPSVGQAVALALMPRALAVPGTALVVDSGRRAIRAVVATLPFYAGGTARRPFHDLV